MRTGIFWFADMYHVTMIHTKSYSSLLINVCVFNYIFFFYKIVIYGRLSQLLTLYPSRAPLPGVRAPSWGNTDFCRLDLASQFVLL